mmetsp:Transcript_21487/g.55819  ORF Transcript_21487/g.55819 Transcript_21487/m.55819 type:complete len:236 (+) Transcript_21487:229-936(+)
MASKVVASRVFVDAAGVRHEILVYGDGSFHGSARHDRSLDGFYTTVTLGGEKLGLVSCPWLTISTGLGALGGRASASAVREAAIRDDAEGFEVVPGEVRNTAVAAHVAFPIARNKLLRREDNAGLATRSNAKAVTERLSSSKSPARAALALIANRSDTVGPLLTRVERGRDGALGKGFLSAHLLGGDGLHDCTHELFGFSQGHALKSGALACLPSSSLGVDFVDEGFIVHKLSSL